MAVAVAWRVFDTSARTLVQALNGDTIRQPQRAKACYP